MCPHATIAYLAPSYCYISTTHVSSYYYICVLILLLYVSSYYYYYICPHTTTICVLRLPHMCPHTAIYVSAYYYIGGRQCVRFGVGYCMLTYADVCCMLTYADVRRRWQARRSTYADVYRRMQTCADGAGVRCGSGYCMLTYADVCRRMPTYADVCRSRLQARRSMWQWLLSRSRAAVC